MITPEELDRALKAGKLFFGKTNKRQVKCCLFTCSRHSMPGTAKRVFVDGHLRGYFCAVTIAAIKGDNYSLLDGRSS